MNTKLFTIIIPTYNRCTMLEESLQILIPQVRRYKDDVRLYVSDNASTDGTKNMVEECLLGGNSDILLYFCQKENLGAQNNFRHAVNAVDSDYVCLLGDDDIVFPNFVETVITILKGNPDIGVLNYNVMSVNYNLQKAALRAKNILGLNPIIYPSGKEFIYEHLRIPSLVSSNVFHRQRFIDQIDKIPVGTYPGYDWMAVLYYSCLSYKCIFIGFPLLLQRYPVEQRWAVDAPWYTIYGIGHLFKDLDEEIPGLYSHWIKHLEEECCGMLDYYLHIVAKNKELYSERYEKMSPYLGVKGYKTKFELYLKYPEKIANTLISLMSYPRRIAKKLSF